MAKTQDATRAVAQLDSSGSPRGRFATRKEVADVLRVPVRTLDQWAYLGTGPRYRKLGRHVRYDWADVDRWIAAQQSGGDAA